VSSSIGIVFERPVEGDEPDDRCALAGVVFESAFKELTRSLRVMPLAEFYSMEPAELDGWLDDSDYREQLKATMGPAEYFQPSDGLLTVRALLAHFRKAQLPPVPASGRDKYLQSDPVLSVLPAGYGVADLVAELSEIERSLELAQQQDVRFYFQVQM
jgi:hypothetical protein